MMKRWRLWGLIVVLSFVAACQPVQNVALPTPAPSAPARDKLRLFWVNSYTEDDFWSQQMRAGILETLARGGYTSVDDTLEMETFHMGMRPVSVIDDVRPAALQAVERLGDFQPNIVIVSGDEATRTIIPLYFDPTLPFVFCGVSSDLSLYGLDLLNVTGVLEALHPVQTVAMAYAFVEDAQQYMVLGDGSVSGKSRALSAYSALGKSEYGTPAPLFRMAATWSRWQTTVLEDASEVDFILLASHQGVVDDAGRLINEQEVITWMLDNSPVPVFALSNVAIINGAVGGLVSYGYEEGVSVGEIVSRLAAGESPVDIEIRGPARSLLAVNMAAAHRWNLRIPITFPLAARIYSTLPASQGGR
jgi:two-component system cell cycle sensor histidine kinase/response regulator CckA